MAVEEALLRTRVSDPQVRSFRGKLGPLSNTMLLGTTALSLPGAVSFRPTPLAGRCTSVTDDIHTDGQTALW